MPDRNRITQLGVEVIAKTISKVRVTQFAVEVIAKTISKVRVTQLAVEVIATLPEVDDSQPIVVVIT